MIQDNGKETVTMCTRMKIDEMEMEINKSRYQIEKCGRGRRMEESGINEADRIEMI